MEETKKERTIQRDGNREERSEYCGTKYLTLILLPRHVQESVTLPFLYELGLSLCPESVIIHPSVHGALDYIFLIISPENSPWYKCHCMFRVLVV